MSGFVYVGFCWVGLMMRFIVLLGLVYEVSVERWFILVCLCGVCCLYCVDCV